MERLFTLGIKKQTVKKSGTTFLMIKRKAPSIYKDLKQKLPNPAELTIFSASSALNQLLI